MTVLYDLFSLRLLTEMIEGGYIRRRDHPSLPLATLGYTEKAAYGRVWNEATLACRGLIYDRETTEVVARPFPKFFNHDEASAEYDPTLPCTVTDKLDGSLGIGYPAPFGIAIATRGSFVSEQAAHANRLYQSLYLDWTPPRGYTPLFEIIYPENRIVVDYGRRDDLVLLGFVDIATGASIVGDPFEVWPGPVVGSLPYTSLSEALAAPPRPNSEGLVVRFSDDRRVKVKQEDYIRLHRILTGFTARMIWKYRAVHGSGSYTTKSLARALHMSVAEVQGIRDAGSAWQEEIERVAPEEFLDWVDNTCSRLKREMTEVQSQVYEAVDQYHQWSRKEAAQALEGHPYRGLIFLALDNRPITAEAWMAVYPEHEKPYRNGEAV